MSFISPLGPLHFFPKPSHNVKPLSFRDLFKFKKSKKSSTLNELPYSSPTTLNYLPNDALPPCYTEEDRIRNAEMEKRKAELLRRDQIMSAGLASMGL